MKGSKAGEEKQQTYREVIKKANEDAQQKMGEAKAEEEKVKPKTCGEHFSESVTVSSCMIGSSLLVVVGCVIALGSYFMFGSQEVGAVAQMQFKDVLSSHASILLIMGIAVVILILGILLRNSCGSCDAKLKTCVSAMGKMCCFGGKDARQQGEVKPVEVSREQF